MPILNFNLPTVALNITQICSMYDPFPAFQYTQDGYGVYSVVNQAGVIRDQQTASAGFPSSPDQYGGLGIIAYPLNSYTINTPLNVYGVNDNTYSVVQVNSSLANIEPGFSRVRIDYISSVADQNGNTAYTVYLDCPFYEGWNTTARELNQIVDYIEGGYNLLQNEVNDLRTEVNYIASRELWRGTSVSGRIQWTPATLGLSSFPAAGSGGDTLTRKTLSDPKKVQYKGMSAKGLESSTTPLYWNQGQGNPDPNVFRAAVSAPGANQKTQWKDNNGNYNEIWGFMDSEPRKGTFYMCENTDGTVTVMFYDWNYSHLHGHTTTNFIWQMGPNPPWPAGSGPYPPAAGANFPRVDVSCAGLTYQCLSTDGVNQTGGPTSWGRITAPYEIGGQSGGVFPLVNGAAPDAHNTEFIFAPLDWVPVASGDSTSGAPVTIYASRSILNPPANLTQLGPPNFITKFQATSNNQYLGDSQDDYGGVLVLHHGAASIPPPPTITSISTPVCQGGIVTIGGTNFYSSNDTITVNGITVTTFINFSTTEISFYLPLGIAGNTTATVLINGGASGTASATLQVLPQPQITSLIDTENNQATNSFFANDTIQINGAGFGATVGSVVFTDAGGTQYSVNSDTITEWTDAQITCSAPALSMANYTLAIYSALCGASIGTYSVVCARGPVTGTPPAIITAPLTVSLLQSQVQQFSATLVQYNESATDVTNQVTWYVNNIAGGNTTVGTVTAGGLYTAPGDFATAEAVTVKASYDYNPTPNNGYNGTYTGNSTVNLYLPGTNAATCNITVSSQINVFLGDGRMGYIPYGTSFSASPGQYVYVQFDELIDPLTKIPLATNEEVQLLAFNAISATDPNVTAAIYNINPINLVGYNGYTYIHTLRTVVLGIIDPSDGCWHSMWDIGLPAPTTPTPVLADSQVEIVQSAIAQDTDGTLTNHPAVATVQTAQYQTPTGTSPSPNPQTVILTNPPTVGNTLIAICSYGSFYNSNLQTPPGSPWVEVSNFTPASGSSEGLVVYTRSVTSTSNNSVTMGHDGSGYQILLMELENVVSVGSFNAVTASNTNIATSSVTLNENDMAIAAFTQDSGTGVDGTPQSGWTEYALVSDGYNNLDVQTYVASTTVTTNGTWVSPVAYQSVAAIFVARGTAPTLSGGTYKKTFSATFPSNPQVGNVLLSAISYDVASGSLTGPSGWSLVGSKSDGTSAIDIFSKTSVGSADITCTATQAITGSYSMVLLELGNAGTISNFTSQTCTGGDWTTPNVTIPAGGLAIAAFAANGEDTPGDPQIGWLDYPATAHDTHCLDVQAYIASNSQTVNGTYEWTTNNGVSVIFTVAIDPPVGLDRLSRKDVSSAPIMAYYGDDLPAFSPGHEFTGSIVEYIDDIAGAHQKQLTHLHKRTNLLITGNCFFNDQTGVFSVIDQLQVLSIDDMGRFTTICTINPQNIKLQLGDFLWIDKETNTLHVNKLGDKFNSRDIVLGVYRDRFYTKWPILPQYMIELKGG